MRNSTEVTNALSISARCTRIFRRRIATYPQRSRIVANAFNKALTRGRLDTEKSIRVAISSVWLATLFRRQPRSPQLKSFGERRLPAYVRSTIISPQSSGR